MYMYIQNMYIYALYMYPYDVFTFLLLQSIRDFAHSSFQYALQKSWPLYMRSGNILLLYFCTCTYVHVHTCVYIHVHVCIAHALTK